MALRHLSIDNFSGFGREEVDFGGGLTVVVGTSEAVRGACGLVYALYQSGEAACSEEDEGGADDPMSHVEGVFAPGDVGDLRGSREEDVTRVKLAYTRPGPHGRAQEVEVSFGLDEDGDPTAGLSFLPSDAPRSWATLLPVDDVLTAYPAFAAADDDDELPLRRDEMDLCFALAKQSTLEVPQDRPLAGVIARLEEVIGGRVARSLDGQGFVVVLPGNHEAVAPKRAETLSNAQRTLATLVIVLRNGAVEPGGLLVWDRPPPKLADALVPVIGDLVRAGVEVVVGTEDASFAARLVEASGSSARTVRLGAAEGDA